MLPLLARLVVSVADVQQFNSFYVCSFIVRPYGKEAEVERLELLNVINADRLLSLYAVFCSEFFCVRGATYVACHYTS